MNRLFCIHEMVGISLSTGSPFLMSSDALSDWRKSLKPTDFGRLTPRRERWSRFSFSRHTACAGSTSRLIRIEIFSRKDVKSPRYF